jgi:RNA polymerase sigma-70 factor (ECF subfamily)
LTVSDLSAEEDDWIEQQLSDTQQPSVENNLVAADLADRVLSVLSPEDQQALLMIDGEQASIKEVAEATGWSESKVKVRAFRARKKVREAMERLLGSKTTELAR